MNETTGGQLNAPLLHLALEEAIALTNNASYGLSAGVWSDNVHTCLAFVRAAQALGASPGYIIRRHLIPNSVSPIIVGFVLSTRWQ